jgi:NAD dependent epimerase/dehydratase family enzyme
LFSGAINATAPTPVTQAEFARALGRVLHRPVRLGIPAGLLRAGLGEMAGMLVDGQRVLPRRALDIGFAFRCHDLDSALRDLLMKRSAQSGATLRLLDHILS